MMLAHSVRSSLRRHAFASSHTINATTFKTTYQQRRPILTWLTNPKEDPVVPKKLTPLRMDDAGSRLLFWDSTYTTPQLKPEFNGTSPGGSYCMKREKWRTMINYAPVTNAFILFLDLDRAVSSLSTGVRKQESKALWRPIFFGTKRQ